MLQQENESSFALAQPANVVDWKGFEPFLGREEAKQELFSAPESKTRS